MKDGKTLTCSAMYLNVQTQNQISSLFLKYFYCLVQKRTSRQQYFRTQGSIGEENIGDGI
jgi:hypothetical protein